MFVNFTERKFCFENNSSIFPLLKIIENLIKESDKEISSSKDTKRTFF